MSCAVKSDKGVVSEFRIKDSNGNEHKPIFKDDDKVNHIFDNAADIFIGSNAIKRMVYSSNSLTLHVKNEDGTIEEIEITKLINLEELRSKLIETPESTEDGEVVLFGSNNGKVLKNSNLKFSNNPDDIDSNDNIIPTSVAIRGYLVRPLEARLGGDNVSENYGD